MKTTLITGAFLSGVIVAVLASIGAPGRPGSVQLVATDRARVADTFGKLALSFIENRGQAGARVVYYVQSPGRSLYFTEDGHALRLSRGKGEEVKAHTVMVELVDATTQRLESRQRAPGVVSYFRGPKEQWRAGIPTHARIGYVQPWPGIDLAYDGSGGRLESIYTVAPNANADQIRLRYSGQDSLKLDDGGNLVYATSVGEVTETAPIAYQEIGGNRIPVEARYALLDERTVGFEVASYDAGHALVIDPTLVYAGYIGGSGHDYAIGVAVDGSGAVYVAGCTASAAGTFPVAGGPDLSYNGDEFDVCDAFVAKTSADGTALVYAGYIGGSGGDFANGVAVDGAGNAYVTGGTTSDETSFPVLGGPDLTYNGNGDAFVAKVNADGSALVYSGYVGGGESDSSIDIAVDSVGNAYLAGTTASSEESFPVLGGPDLVYNGTTDAFVAKVNADGSALLYAGYIGGALFDGASGVTVDNAGNAYVVGSTQSTQTTFPVLGGPDLTYNGGGDTFVAKVNADGNALTYAGYIGGSGSDSAGGIAVDNGGSTYVAGRTASTESTFPVLGGPDLIHNGGSDVFVAKVNADGSALTYAGFIGGSVGEGAGGIAVDAFGNAYVTGEVSSTESSFPVLGGPDLLHNGGADSGFDAFVAKVNVDGSALVYAGYIGGSGGDESGHDIAVDSAGNAYVAGYTNSTETTFPVTVGPDLTHNGTGDFDVENGYDAFVAKITEVDNSPDAFAFADQADVAIEAEITSAAVTIDGLDATAPIGVTGGTYSIDSGPFTSVAGTVGNGQQVQVRHTSSGTFSTATHTVLSIGGWSDIFTSTTEAPPPDSIPDMFIVTDAYAVARSADIISFPVTITGINVATDISVEGGTYSIDGGAFTSDPGTVSNGQSVRVRHTSSADYSTATHTALTVGGEADAFTSTTVAAPTPDEGDGGGGSLGLPLIAGLAGLFALRQRRRSLFRRQPLPHALLADGLRKP